VSNDLCYKAFAREENGEFTRNPAAYLNLEKPREKYPPDPKIKGCLELLRLLLPGSYPRTNPQLDSPVVSAQ